MGKPGYLAAAGVLAWVVVRVSEHGFPRDDFGNLAFVDMVIAALTVLVAPSGATQAATSVFVRAL